jgi:hypothetical protein
MIQVFIRCVVPLTSFVNLAIREASVGTTEVYHNILHWLRRSLLLALIGFRYFDGGMYC